MRWERFERSPWGRSLISALIVLLLIAEIGTNLPPSAFERTVGESADQLVRVFASEQTWGVFAPDPRSTSLDLEARVTFMDGSATTWDLPTGPSIGANLRYYRWRKWLERVRSDDYRGQWRPTARWIASLYDDRDSPVAQVELIRHFRDNVVRGEQPPYDQFTFYTYEPVDER
ncbi:MAG: hypothetical protein Q8K58_00115 [Acidimicrobiales bacterium]|nr:hypothetical protein [Acidimicrobiales bacterium]